VDLLLFIMCYAYIIVGISMITSKSTHWYLGVVLIILGVVLALYLKLSRKKKEEK
jgi:membrane protein implicated in regulation of membrane protease activity